MPQYKEKYYLKIGRAPDLKDSKERKIYRALEILPGFLVWATLISMVIFSLLKPQWVGYFILVFCIMWFIRVFHFSVHLTASYRQLKKNLKTDWLAKLESEEFSKDWEDIHHLIILPMYKEGLDIVRETFKALSACKYPKDKIIVALATEERAGKEAQKVADAVSREFGGKFRKFMVTCHPKDIPGELAGKGSNEAWAGRKVKEEFIDPAGIPYENVIASVFDVDTQVFPQYFSCLAYNYLTVPDAERASFQPIPLYLNNVWEAPFFSRVVSSSNVFWQAMQQERPEKLVTYSSHSMSFKAAAEMGFWQTNVVSEDAGVFWKAFLFYDGDYKIVPLHYPVSMDCVTQKTFWKTAVNQYKQQRRWAWGSEGIPYLLFGFLKNKKIPLKKKLCYSFLIIEGFWAWGTNALMILFLGWLPVILGGQEFNTSILAYNLPGLTGRIMTVAMLGIVVCIFISLRLLSPRPQKYGRRKSLGMVAQWLFFPVAFIVFGAIPSIDAQTRLMLGKYMKFWVTEKVR